MSSHSSNNSNADIEVINPEDLEESPPPEVESQSVPEDVENSTLVTEVVEGTGAGGDSTEQIGEIEDAEEKPEAVPIPADKEDDDDPPIEILNAPTPPQEPAPLVEAPPTVPSVEPANDTPAVAKEADPIPQPAPVAVRPSVTVERPAATLEEVDDDEEDDDDIDETLTERLIGLTEMFPDFVRDGSVSVVKGSWSLTQSCYSLARAASWVIFSSATILFMPVMIESERLQLQDQQKAQKNQILLGPGAAVSGGPSLGPPPI